MLETGTLNTLLMRMYRNKQSQVTWQFLTVKQTAHYSTIPLLDIYPKETNVYQDWYRKCIAVLLIITHTWKSPKFPSIDECVNKLWHIHIMKHYLAIKKDHITDTPCMDPEAFSEGKKKSRQKISQTLFI